MAKSKRQKHNVFDVFLEIMYGFNKKIFPQAFPGWLPKVASAALSSAETSIFTMKN